MNKQNLKMENITFPNESAKFEKLLSGVIKNHLESSVKNTDFWTSSQESVTSTISRSEVDLGIAFFSNKVVKNHNLEYTALQGPNAYLERINPHHLPPSVSFFFQLPLLMYVVWLPYKCYLS